MTRSIETSSPVGTATDDSRKPQATLEVSSQQDSDVFDYVGTQARISELLGKQIFFIGGMPRSGTTWLQLLLDLHPQVSCSTERHFVSQLMPALKEALERQNRYLLEKQNTVFQEIGRKYPFFEAEELKYVFVSALLILLQKQVGLKSVRAVGEKTPENMEVFTGLIRLVPGAKCIQIVRDPRDAAVSAWFHVLRVMPEETNSHFPTMSDYLRHYADIWTRGVAAGVEFGRRNPGRYMDLRYEDLIERPEATLRRVFGFLGVDQDPEIVRGCLSGASFEKLSGGRIPGQEDRGSFFRKGRTGDWQTYFDARTRKYVMERDGALMRHFGFL